MNDLRTLIDRAKAASDAYYNSGTEIMSDHEYDELVRTIEREEKEQGIVYPDSPTQTVGYTVSGSFPKVKHEVPSLSLDKTKDRKLFVRRFDEFLHDEKRNKRSNVMISNSAVLMWKMDGSTLVATYDGGKLTRLATRGNGEIGSDITANAPFVHGIPKEIPFKGHLIVRGEAVMSYDEFERLNASLPAEAQYKNPRNLANASVMLLDNKELAGRRIDFFAFCLVATDAKTEGPDREYRHDGTAYRLTHFSERLNLLDALGFNTVERAYVHIGSLEDAMKVWDKRAETYGYPVDGLVAAADDADYAETLPGTGHNPNIMCGYAFKWADEEEETVLRDIEWSASRTGLLNPVAVFDPVELEGTTVTRASLHNVSYIRDKRLMPGDRITVYKANKIIPQISANLDADKHEDAVYPDVICPVCGSRAVIKTSDNSDTVVAICPDCDCPAKKIGSFVHYCERDCADIRGMSEETVTKFVNAGFLKELGDIYRLDEHRDEIVGMEGFGEKSYKNLHDTICASARLAFIPFIHALGIPNIGKGQAKLLYGYLAKEYRKSHDIYQSLGGEMCGKQDMFYALCVLISEGFDFTNIEGFGPVLNESIYSYFTKDRTDDVLYFSSETELGRLLDQMEVIPEWPEDKPEEKLPLKGFTFVITGAVHHYKNRDELKETIEKLGGKATGSVTKNTDYLINNDLESTSGKNKKAKELGVKIISEDEFLAMI